MTDPQTEKPKSWSRRKRARPGEILDAALNVFAEKGYAAARMEDIAAAAGVTKGTIYLYYSNKEDVFKTLARDVVGQALADAAIHAKDFPGTPKQLMALILTRINGFLQKPERAALPKIILAESGNFPELARFWRDEVVEKAVGMLADTFAQGVAAGQFRDLPPDNVARLSVAPILLGVIWRTTFARFDTVPVDFDAIFAVHLDVLMNGLSVQKEQK